MLQSAEARDVWMNKAIRQKQQEARICESIDTIQKIILARKLSEQDQPRCHLLGLWASTACLSWCDGRRPKIMIRKRLRAPQMMALSMCGIPGNEYMQKVAAMK